jgi:hypothetical protein
MLLLRESHSLVGLHEDEFEDVIRDEWLPMLARTDDVRLLYYLHLAHGSGPSYTVVTYTWFRDAAAWEALARRFESGDLQTFASELDGMRHEVEARFLHPLPWSPLQTLDIDAIPTETEEH